MVTTGDRAAVQLVRLSGAAVLLLAATLFAVMPKAPVRSNVDGLGGAVVGFELASTPEHVFGILGEPGDPARAAAVKAMDRTNRIDFLFMLAYPTLCVSIAVLLVARGHAPGAFAWVVGVLAVVMFAGDCIENLQLLTLSQLTDAGAMAEPLGRLRIATTAKWGALFLAAILEAAVVWRDASAWRRSAPLFAAGGLLGLAGVMWLPGVEYGANVVAIAWLWTWIHALRS